MYPHKPEYYGAAVTILRERWGAQCEVVVLSDDMAWCRDNIRTTYTAIVYNRVDHSQWSRSSRYSALIG